MNMKCVTPLIFMGAATLATASNLTLAKAASLRVSPILIEAGAQANTSITLSNRESRPLNAQVRVFRWSQKDGQENLVPTDDIVASPPIISIGSHEDYVVRLQRTVGEEPIDEEAYRVVVDELPNPDRQRNGTVAVVIRYIVPAFFSSAEASQPRLKWSLGHRDGHTVIVAENSGDKRIQVTNLGLKTGSRTVVIEKGLAGYVLGHSVKEWPLGLALSNIRGATVVAMSDHGAISVSLAP
jgi:fimbrial chaperone protein